MRAKLIDGPCEGIEQVPDRPPYVWLTRFYPEVPEGYADVEPGGRIRTLPWEEHEYRLRRVAEDLRCGAEPQAEYTHVGPLA